MLGQLTIVVAIDVEAALAEGTLANNIYAVDNYKFNGSTGQGTRNLTTYVCGNQILNWLATGIDIFGTYPMLEGIDGDAVEKQIMVPQQFQSPDLYGLGLWWGATVDARVSGIYNYTLRFDMDGVKMAHDFSVNVQRAFSNQSEGEGFVAAGLKGALSTENYKAFLPRHR